MDINIHSGFGNQPMRGVVCPDCGSCGGSRSPCWCYECHKKGIKVLMIPSVNKFTFVQNWNESFKS